MLESECFIIQNRPTSDTIAYCVGSTHNYPLPAKLNRFTACEHAHEADHQICHILFTDFDWFRLFRATMIECS